MSEQGGTLVVHALMKPLTKVELVEGCRSATFEEKNKCFFDFLKCISGKDLQFIGKKSAN